MPSFPPLVLIYLLKLALVLVGNSVSRSYSSSPSLGTTSFLLHILSLPIFLLGNLNTFHPGYSHTLFGLNSLSLDLCYTQ